MRVELIQCDECQKTHNTQNPIPASWIKIEQTGRVILHFCSDACLLHHLNSRTYGDWSFLQAPRNTDQEVSSE